MINRSEMLKQTVIKERLPTPTDQQVQVCLRTKIDAVRRSVELPIRMGYTDEYARSLFTITAENYSCLKGMDWREGDIWRVESNRLQQLGLEVMREYGFDETNTVPYKGIQKWKNEVDTSREFKSYPSKTIKGLTFERERKLDTVTGKTISVSWEVIDDAPPFKVSWRRKAKK